MYKKIVIELHGDTDDDIDTAIAEVFSLLGEGYSSGFNSNETGSFSFETTENEA